MRRPRSSPLGAALLALAVLPAQAGARQTTDAPPAGWVSAAFREIQRSEYEVTRQADAGRSGAAGTFQAPNRAQGLRTYFAPEGIRVVPRLADPTSWEWRASLSACGRAGSLRQAGRAEPQACNDRVEYRRDGLTEWYVNEPRGLEQGFTIAAPPAGSGPLALEIGLAGALQPALAADGRSVFFATPQGVRALEYGQLAASDARGAPLSAWFEVEHGLLRILVDDARAAYPLTIDPLITTPAWLVEGNQAYCGFGFAAATAGDINGDGHGDMIVGAPYYDAGQADEGRVFVYLGGFTVWTAEGNRKNALFGASVATAGDVNGDGYADVIVGETGLDGRVYVYHGGPAGLGSAPSFQAQSEQYGKGFGHSVGTAGDVNDDGFSDASVREPHFDGNQENEGRALVYHGSPLGLQAPAAWVDYGTQSDEEFGCCVATAGDVNGGARADVIVGAHGHDNGQNDEGRAFVYHGAPSGLAGAPAWTGESDQDGEQSGYAVGTAGDVDGDGCADVLAA
ncbi:MAG: FG-GAP repeat protein, partial [Planctomycetes bacterium]|nr:FG-GAP repeat protein [Planctomycetota bacterium]